MTDEKVRIRFLYSSKLADGTVATDLHFDSWDDFIQQWNENTKDMSSLEGIIFLKSTSGYIGLRLGAIAQIHLPINVEVVPEELPL